MSKTKGTKQGQRELYGPDAFPEPTCAPGRALRVAGLFAGIGGIERGLDMAGHSTSLFCENDPSAQAVLAAKFGSDIPLHSDVKGLKEIPRDIDLVTAGFPCQDLSQAGLTAGINGARSGLIDEVFRLLRGKHEVPWILLENVPFMLQLSKGAPLEHIVTALEKLGYDWAYRVVDTRSTGLPQRRQRVFLLASKEGDPRDVILSEDAGAPQDPDRDSWRNTSCGFYWTEGLRGLGWAYNAIPTLKAGSSVGIPSPPAIILKSGEIVTPDIVDAERFQGFPVDWTKPAVRVSRASYRWRLVGNAVSVPVAKWIGSRLMNPGRYDAEGDVELHRSGSWPMAAWSIGGRRYVAEVSAFPVAYKRKDLETFFVRDTKLLSEKATAGFLGRIKRAKLRFPPGFEELIEAHLERIRNGQKRKAAAC